MSHVSHICAFARLCASPLFIPHPKAREKKNTVLTNDACLPFYLPFFSLSIFLHPSFTLSLYTCLSARRVRQLCSLYFSLRPHQFQPIYTPLPPPLSPRSSLSFPLKSVTYLQHSCLMNNGGETVTISVSIRRICFDLGCSRQPRFAFPQRLPAQLYSHLLSLRATSNFGIFQTQQEQKKRKKQIGLVRAGGKQFVQLHIQGSAAITAAQVSHLQVGSAEPRPVSISR